MRKWIRGGSWLATREISFKMCWFIPNNFCIKIWKRRNSTEWWSTHFVGVITPHHRLSCHLQSRPCIYVLTNQATIITMHTNTDAIHFIRTSVMFPSVHDGLKIDRVKKTYSKFRWSNQLYSLPCFPFLFYSSQQMPVICVPFFDPS